MNFLRARVRELKVCDSDYTATVMLVGVPNVGKSAMANSLHQIGRISAAGYIFFNHFIDNRLVWLILCYKRT